MARGPNTWSMVSAQAHLAEVIERAVNEGPQTITRRGRNGRERSWISSNAHPFEDAGIEIERVQDGPREVDL
jgi:hypothetical protein